MHTIPALLLILLLIAVQGQRLTRRTSVRAALANKLDPNFWPTRGRRAEQLHSRQSSDDDGPFWANRGRSLNDLDGYWVNDDEGPFWANRGRGLQRLQRDILYADEPSWIALPQHAGRRSAAEEKPDTFWVSRGKKHCQQLLETQKCSDLK